MSEEKIPISESVAGFNTFSVEIRNKIEGLIKQVLLISGGIQTITISAFLTAEKPKLTEATVGLLKAGWLELSASIVLCLILLLLQVFTLINIGFKHVDKLETRRAGVEIFKAWLPLRITNWVVGLSAFGFCVVGVVTISRAAISLIGA